MDAREVAEAIREALAGKGQVSDVEIVDSELAVRFGLTTAVEGFEGVREFQITVEEREAASAP